MESDVAVLFRGEHYDLLPSTYGVLYARTATVSVHSVKLSHFGAHLLAITFSALEISLAHGLDEPRKSSWYPVLLSRSQ